MWKNAGHIHTQMAECNPCNEGFGSLERSERPVLTQGGGGLMQGGPSLTFPFLPPAGCSPVAAELNHCEHGTHSLFTCGLSPAAAQPGQEAICC